MAGDSNWFSDILTAATTLGQAKIEADKANSEAKLAQTITPSSTTTTTASGTSNFNWKSGLLVMGSTLGAILTVVVLVKALK